MLVKIGEIMKVSVIIPVYNVEKYIKKCIQSLLDQTYSNFEAIIVDDGSVDNSIEIAKQLANNDSRFIFLEKNNGGQASARNMGLDFASGEYISFLDADDYFDNTAFDDSINCFKKNSDIEIVLFGHYWITQNNNIINEFIPNVEHYYDNKDIFLAFNTIDNSPCTKIYKASVIQKYRFTEGIIYEDAEMIFKVIYNSSLAVVARPLYYYVQRNGSTMHSYNRIALDSYLFLFQTYQKFLISNNISQEYEKYYKQCYFNTFIINFIVYLARYSPNYKYDVEVFNKKVLHNKISILSGFNYLGFSKKSTMLLIFRLFPMGFQKVIKFFDKYKSKYKGR